MSLKTSIYEIKVARIRLENNKKKKEKKRKTLKLDKFGQRWKNCPYQFGKQKQKKKKEKERLV